MNINKQVYLQSLLGSIHTYIRKGCTVPTRCSLHVRELRSPQAQQSQCRMGYKEFTDQSSNQVEVLQCETSTLLSSYFVISLLKLIRRKQTDKHLCRTRAAPCVQPLPYPSSFTPQCSGIKHPLKSVVLLRQSAAHYQLLIFAPSITQLILKKKNKHLLFSGIYKYLPQFSRSLQNQLQKLTAHYVQTLPKYTEEPSRGTLSDSTSHRLELPSARSALLPLRTLERRRCLAQCHKQSLGWCFSRKELVLLVKELHLVT